MASSKFVKKGFIYVPSINLYVAKKRTHYNLNHSEAKEALRDENSLMLNMFYFAEFLKHLKFVDPSDENLDIYNDITEVREPFRGEYINDRFSKKGKRLHVTYDKINKNGLLEQVTEPLLACLMQDRTPGIDLEEWVKNHNSQGFPYKNVKKNGSMYYWKPEDGTVARFDANSNRAYLYCDRDPGCSFAGLGVRAAKFEGFKVKLTRSITSREDNLEEVVENISKLIQNFHKKFGTNL